MDEELKEEYLKKHAIKIIWNFIKLYYLKTHHRNESNMIRMFINLNLKYMTKNFKIQRLYGKINIRKCMSKELDLDEILNKIKRDITLGLDPLKDGLEEYYLKTIKKDDFNNLKESTQLIDAFLKNSKQMWNLVRILKHDKYLEGLTSINEVYDSQVNLLEEVIHFHNLREAKTNGYKVVISEQSSQNEEGIMKGFDFNLVFDTHNVIDKN